MRFTAIVFAALFFGLPLSASSAGAQYSPDPYVNRVILIQQELAVLGFNPGPPDGILGKRTKAAIRGFQATIGAPQTGVLTQRQLELLNGTVRSRGTDYEQMNNE